MATLSVLHLHTRSSMVLPGGQVVQLRNAWPGDSTLVVRMFFRLSPSTIYYRLFVPAPQTPEWAARFAALAVPSEADRVAMVALLDGEVVGFANYADTSKCPHEAELALVVEDTWQRQGIGRALLTALVEEARRQDVEVFNAIVMGENSRALRFLTRFFPWAEVRLEDREFAVRATLQPDWQRGAGS
jgi:GNAT superfamily N-acetyltransferase